MPGTKEQLREAVANLTQRVTLTETDRIFSEARRLNRAAQFAMIVEILDFRGKLNSKEPEPDMWAARQLLEFLRPGFARPRTTPPGPLPTNQPDLIQQVQTVRRQSKKWIFDQLIDIISMRGHINTPEPEPDMWLARQMLNNLRRHLVPPPVRKAPPKKFLFFFRRRESAGVKQVRG